MMNLAVSFNLQAMGVYPAMRRDWAEPAIATDRFRFNCAPIWECPLLAEHLSEKTQSSIGRSPWVSARGMAFAGPPAVYLCEACGGADPAELAALFAAIAAAGQRAILVWTDDWAFPVPSSADLLVFDIVAPPARACTYTWETWNYGPDMIEGWKPFQDRPILASFIGARTTHAVREIVFDGAVLGRPDIFIEDVDWWGTMGVEGGHEFRMGKSRQFADVLANSKFAFCPRGNGPSSKRRWEAGYCGAVPILIDDITTPFGVTVPGVSFLPDRAASVHDNAMALLAHTVAQLGAGARLQQELRQCLLSRFDVPAIWAGHTTTRLIIEAANRAWVPGHGFAADLS